MIKQQKDKESGITLIFEESNIECLPIDYWFNGVIQKYNLKYYW